MIDLSIPEILSKKRNGEELKDEELDYFIDCVCKEKIDRSQVS
jgi:thymidine phosphorylase